MQTLNWYYQRLKAMSPDEIAWRACSSIRDIADRLLIERRQRPRKPSDFLNSNTSGKKEGFHVCNMSVGYQTNNDAEKQSYDSLIAKAQKIVGHRLSFFDLQDKYLGEPITWNRDHKREKDTPMTFSPALDYRAPFRLIERLLVSHRLNLVQPCLIQDFRYNRLGHIFEPLDRMARHRLDPNDLDAVRLLLQKAG